MTGEALRIIGDIARLRLEPGDVLVVKVADHLTMTQAATLKGNVQEQFPDHKVLVLAGGVELMVLT